MKLLVAIIIVLSFLSLEGSASSHDPYGSITEQPEDYVAVLGDVHLFTCKYEYNNQLNLPITYEWTVTIGERTWDTARSTQNSELQESMKIVKNAGTLRVPANSVTNGTVVYCRARESVSNPASLTVLGPPTPPEPVLMVVGDLLNITWAPAWSWDSHPVTHYTVTVTNTTNGEVYVNHTNETFWYHAREEGAEPRCDVMVVNVTATNDIGESVARQTTGGFPTPPAPFELLDCDACKVTFFSTPEMIVPMYTIKFKLPDICTYQTGHYRVSLFGPELAVPIDLVDRTEYTSANTTDLRTLEVDSAMHVNKTYTVAVIVSNSEGTINANITFDTELQIPPSLLNKNPVVITVTENKAVLIAGVVIGVVLLASIVVVITVVGCLYRRRRRTGAAEFNLAKIFMEDSFNRPPRGGPYTHTESRVYETIDGYQGKTFDPSPPYPPPLPSIPPARDHQYTTDQLTVPRIVLGGDGDRDSNGYLQLLSEGGKVDPEVRSTGSGEYTAMKSVSLMNPPAQNVSAVNRLAVQTPQGFNEDNYMVFMEQSEKKE